MLKVGTLHATFRVHSPFSGTFFDFQSVEEIPEKLMDCEDPQEFEVSLKDIEVIFSRNNSHPSKVTFS